jgi:NADH dehydrogenase
MGEVTGVELTEARVLTSNMPPLRFDFLVLATGATHSYFGHEEWAPMAPGLKRIEDATEIRRRLLLAFEKAEIESDLTRRAQQLSFVIIGAGPTGVELAGAIAEVAHHTLSRDFRRIDPGSARIILVEAGPRILSAFPEKLGDYARRSLERMGVTVRTETAIVACDADGVATAAGEHISAATLIWAAGVRASPAAQWTGTPADRAGRVQVKPDLSIPGRPNVFAVGDTASVQWTEGKAVPGIAPAAKQMGRYVGALISAELAERADRTPFSYRHHGDLATIGRRSAIVAMRRLRLTGWFAWVFWSVAHIYFLIGVRNRLKVAVDWLWEYITFQRGARIIQLHETSVDAPPR